MRAADLFVMPSHMEGLCTSLLDAMFAQLPLVTTAAGGIADVVGATDAAGAVSYLAPPRDSQALSQAIQRALANRQETANLVERAYRRAHAMFTHQSMVEGTLAVYDQLLCRRGRHAA